MLGDIGVPDQIVSELSGLTKAAYEFWQSDWREKEELSSYVSNPTTRPDTMADYYSRVRQRVERAFSIVESYYGEDVADALCKWADRLFVDPKGSRQLSFWRSILLGIVDDELIDSQSVIPEALFQKLDMIDDVILRYLDYPAELHFEKQLSLANQIPLSPIEKRMIQIEVTQPNDPAEVDLSVWLHVISQRYRVFLVWQNFMDLLTLSELQGILQLARKVEGKQNEEWLIIPDLSGS
jgi:hypothetical protein